MQITRPQHLPAGRQGNIVEKVLRDKEGRLVRARFAVYESAGRLKARLLDVSYIETLTSAVVSLLGFIQEKAEVIFEAFQKSFHTPVFATEAIYINGSKPRAPTF